MKKDEALSKFKDAMDRRNVCPKTQKSYLFHVGKFLDYCTVKTFKSPQEYVDNFILTLKNWRTTYKGKPFKISTLNLYVCAIKKYFELVHHKNIKAKDIVYLKEDKRLPRVLSTEEIKRLFGVLNNMKHRLLIALAYGCGLRVSEVISIRNQDIRFDNNMIVIFGKGHRERTVSIKNIPPDLIKHSMSDKEYLFLGQNGEKHLTDRSAQKTFKRACYMAGIHRPLSFHSLRHSFCTNHLRQGTDILKIKLLAGHANIKTTAGYIHIANKELMDIDSPIKDVMGF